MICAMCNRTIETPVHPEVWPEITCCSDTCAAQWQAEMTFTPVKSFDEYEQAYAAQRTIKLVSPTGKINKLIASPKTASILETLLNQGWKIV